MSVLGALFHRKAWTPETVSLTEEEVIRTMSNGHQERVRWDDLQEVSIVTTDEGPFADDFFWVLTGKSGGCAVSSLAKGSNELLSRLQSLPGFNNEAILHAAGSTKNAKFVCWTRDQGR